jgi:hypothetical protein
MPATARRLVGAFLAGDAASAAALLASDARFHSPIRDYVGAREIGSVWEAVAGVVQDARETSVYERERETISFFVGRVKDRSVDGVVRALTDENGRVSDVLLMIRPWAALKAGLADVPSR